MATGSSGRAEPPGRGQVLASRVIGRERERAVLRGALERARAGRGEVAFLAGEPGIGKSRLTQVVAEDATRGGTPMIGGRAVRTATPLAYRPLAEALCAAVRRGVVWCGVVSEADPGLSPFRPILGALIPEWRTDRTRTDDSVLAIAEGVLRFLRVAAGATGCLLVLEDLHWSDPETLRVVEYLADNLASEHVLCLVTVRDEEPSSGREIARALEARRGVSSIIELPRLRGDEVAELVGSCLGAAAVSDDVVAVADRADGIPFLVEELLTDAVSSGALVVNGSTWSRSSVAEPSVPATFADGVRRRLATLGRPTRLVLLAAATLGRTFDWRLLPAVTGVDEDEVHAALRAAVDARLVSADGRGVAGMRSGSVTRSRALERALVLANDGGGTVADVEEPQAVEATIGQHLDPPTERMEQTRTSLDEPLHDPLGSGSSISADRYESATNTPPERPRRRTLDWSRRRRIRCHRSNGMRHPRSRPLPGVSTCRFSADSM